MVSIRRITEEEARQMNSRRRAAYWAIPMAFTLAVLLAALLLNWWFNAPWSLFWWISGGIFILFCTARLFVGKSVELRAGETQIIRRAKVVEAAYKGNSPGMNKVNAGQFVEIVLETEPLPDGYPIYHSFEIYRSVGMPYYKQDNSLKYRYKLLEGTEVEIEYLAESGLVLAFRELDPASNPPAVQISFGMISLGSPINKQLERKRLDFVGIGRDKLGHGGIHLRSDSVESALFVPFYAQGLDTLEDWLFALPGFDKPAYSRLKGEPPANESLLWERRVKYGVSYRSVYAGERVNVIFGNIGVYRNNGHNESMRTDEVDYITVNSVCTNKPNSEFFLNLRSYNASGVSLQSRAEGFDKLERWMMQLPAFDAGAYGIARESAGEEAVTIWLRKPEANARFLDESGKFDDLKLQQGIELEGRHILLEWGTFGKLRLMKGVRMKRTRYPNPDSRGYTFYVRDPVVLGGLQLETLFSESPPWHVRQQFNPEWPVTGFWADVSLANDGLADFELLQQHLQRHLGTPDGHSDPGIDGENSLWAHWLRQRVTIKISTWKPWQLDRFRHGCRLEITREPEVGHFFRDDYSSSLTLHDDLHYLVLPGVLAVPNDYVQDTNARYTPQVLANLLADGNQWVVWLDKRAGKFGMGNAQFVKIADLKAFRGLLLTGSYWRDSPTGLIFHLPGNKEGGFRRSPENYFGKLDLPDEDSGWLAIARQLGDFLGHPCQYVEDRQYY